MLAIWNGYVYKKVGSRDAFSRDNEQVMNAERFSYVYRKANIVNFYRNLF